MNQNTNINRLSGPDISEYELNRQNTAGIKSNSITSSKTVFLLCGSCYWCASLIGAERQIGFCPICSTVVTLQLPMTKEQETDVNTLSGLGLAKYVLKEF